MWRLAASFSAVGIEMAAAVAIGTLGGQKLERWLDLGPWVRLVGFGVGVAAAGLALYRAIATARRLMS